MPTQSPHAEWYHRGRTWQVKDGTVTEPTNGLGDAIYTLRSIRKFPPEPVAPDTLR